MIVDHKDLYNTARTIVEIHGSEAEVFATKVIEGLSAHDRGGLAVWHGILKAIREIQKDAGTAIH